MFERQVDHVFSQFRLAALIVLSAFGDGDLASRAIPTVNEIGWSVGWEVRRFLLLVDLFPFPSYFSKWNVPNGRNGSPMYSPLSCMGVWVDLGANLTLARDPRRKVLRDLNE